MRTFAQKQNQPHQKSSASLTRSNKLASSPSHDAHPLLNLQRTIGNQAVLRLLQARADGLGAASNTEVGSTSFRSETPSSNRFDPDLSRMPVHAQAEVTIQPKLAVNTPGDIYEQEADHIAEQVMRMPEPKLQRACDCAGGCPSCQTEQPVQEQQRMQTKQVGPSDSRQVAAPPIVHEVLASTGQPMAASARAFFEPRFGHDFSQVRVHADTKAAESADAVNARAYTVGKHVVFGRGQPSPETTAGRQLLAHELTHIVQQNGAKSGSVNQAGQLGFAPTLVQRDVTSDISLDSVDFWTHLRSRTFTRLIGWIGDSRQKLNEFVHIMDETNTPSLWGSAALSWIQAFIGGPEGLIFKALATTIQAVLAKVDTPSTLFEFQNMLERNFDDLSVRVNDLKSDLPIYQALRQAEIKANVGTQNEQRANRERARGELETALNALPSPDGLKKALVQGWITTATRTQRFGGDFVYSTSYSVVKSDSLSLGGTKPTRNTPVRRSGSDYFVAEIAGAAGKAGLHIQRPEQTLKALRNAYATSTFLHTLPFPMTIKFWVYSPGESGPMGGTRSFTWRRDPVSRIWAPTTGLGSEEQDAVFQDWYDRGVKPTLADLETEFIGGE